MSPSRFRLGRTPATLVLLVGLLVLGALGATHAEASSKGSSCADPYRVNWNVPTFTAHNNHGVQPGLFYGDTSLIEAHANGEGTTRPNLDYFVVSWKPRVGGLKFCEARITFTHHKTFVSHQWHRKPVKIPGNPEDHITVTSFTVTAAR